MEAVEAQAHALPEQLKVRELETAASERQARFAAQIARREAEVSEEERRHGEAAEREAEIAERAAELKAAAERVNKRAKAAKSLRARAELALSCLWKAIAAPDDLAQSDLLNDAHVAVNGPIASAREVWRRHNPPTTPSMPPRCRWTSRPS